VVKCLGNEQDAHDIVQESYEKLWINRKKVALDKSRAWLFTAARNALLNLVKRRKIIVFEDGHTIEAFVESNDFELRDLINKALDKLPEIQKSIILLRDLEGYNYKEIGEILNLTEAQVKVYLFRGRQKVKNQLRDISVLVA
jgi:RNA polymerase sigma-70 factor (ECF subfamily)